jgi:ASC-1-like (ASCH) protein
MNLRFFLICVCLLFLGYANDIQAQDSLVYKVPNLKTFSTKAKGVVAIIAKPFTFLQRDSQRKNSTKQSKKIDSKSSNPAKSKKEIQTGSYNPIKIPFPKFKLIHFSKIVFWKKSNVQQKVPKHQLKQLRKSKFEKLRDKVEDINTLVYQLDKTKDQYLVKKEDLEAEIKSLNQYDSLRFVLKNEINESLLPTTASVAVPVGFMDIDEQVRNLQLLEKIPSDNALTIRPYNTNASLSYSKLLHLIDSNIKYGGVLYQRKHTSLGLLPVNVLQKFNTDRPYGWNDGAMNYSKGYQFQVSGGVYASWHNLKIQLRPEYVSTASGRYEINNNWGEFTKSVKKVLPGQSSIRFDFGGVSLSASTQNLWWGPGIQNSMLMSNNAPGFLHYSFATNRPLKSFLGNFQFQLVSGTLKSDTSQGYEHRGFKKRPSLNNDRYFSGFTLSYQPAFMKNISFGITRVFQNYADNNIVKFVPKYLPVIGSFFGSAYNDTTNRDQVLAFNTRWLFPKNHAEVYFEFGYNDAKDNFRDLMVDMSHSSGYIFGFKKLSYLNSIDYLDFGAEVTRMAQTPSYLMRNAGNFYEHGGVKEGYTNQNQIIGAGNGFGNNMQTVQLSWNRAWNKFGFIFNHIAQNPNQIITSDIANLGLRTVKWDDYSFGIQTRYRYRNILFSANMEYVNSKNYLWKDKHNATNFYAFLNTIFLW